MMITTAQAIKLWLASMPTVDIKQWLSVGELPVWIPPALRHEHNFEQLSANLFECIDCGYQVLIERPDAGEGECQYLS